MIKKIQTIILVKELLTFIKLKTKMKNINVFGVKSPVPMAVMEL